jgi:NADH dehydrogenase/NADH:ubiquinone oxidoreductase subunit G
VLLAIGDERWSELHAGSFSRLILATSQPLDEDPRVEVLLPMAHAYERQGTITNLEGRVQHQEGGASPPTHARADWGVLGALAQQLDIPGSPDELETIRSLVADEHPAMSQVLREEALIARV